MSGAEQPRSITTGPGALHPNWAPAALRDVAEFVEARAGPAPWIRFGEIVLSSRDIVQQATVWSEKLAGLGVGRGIRVGLLMRNRPEFIVGWLAINRLGACAVFLPTTMPAALLSQYAGIAELDAVLAETELLSDEFGTSTAERIALADDVVARRTTAGRQAAPGIAGDGDPAAILFTSGSSGFPKAVIFSHRYVLELGHTVAHGKGFAQGERMFFCSPMFHGDGVLAVLISLIVGGELHLVPRFSASSFWDDVARHGSTMFYFVGATLSFLLRTAPTVRPENSLRFTTGGGAPEIIARGFEERFGIPVLEAYSQTECLACCSNTLVTRKTGTVGKPYPGVELRIVDALDQPVAIGKVGEIVVRPPRAWMTFSGYLGNPVASAEKLRNLLLHTGDLGSMDDEGFVRFHGRLGHGLRRRGENLPPEQIELMVEQLPWVKKAAAVGIASEHGDQDIFLLILPGMEPPLEKDLIAQCLAVLPKVMQPSYIEIVDDLPMTPTNKLLRPDLPKRPGKHGILLGRNN
jgi:carnitine-CoA ligase